MREAKRRRSSLQRPGDPPWWVWPFLVVPMVLGSWFLTFAVAFGHFALLLFALGEPAWGAFCALWSAVCAVWAWRENGDEA